MSDIYRKLQRTIVAMKGEYSGGTDMYSSATIDTFLGGSPRLTRTAKIQGTPEQIASLTDAMLEMLAVLRSMYWIHQNSHWQSAGSTFYGDHLLFQRLYEETADDVDGVAEKAVAFLGCELVDPAELFTRAKKWVDEWCASPNPVMRSMAAEKSFMHLAKEYYTLLKKLDIMTLGLDDEIMSLCNSHESHIYLLQQRLEQVKVASRTKKASGRIKTASSRRILLSSLGDLTGFFRLSTDVLVRKCEKDLWKITKDADGNDVIEKLYDGDVLSY